MNNHCVTRALSNDEVSDFYNKVVAAEYDLEIKAKSTRDLDARTVLIGMSNGMKAVLDILDGYMH